MIRRLRPALAATAALLAMAGAHAADVYNNDFELGSTAGLTAGGTLSGLSTGLLPSGSGGPGVAPTSHWLGRLGEGLPKDNPAGETVTLALTGLSAGTTYAVDFRLLVGGSWDGSAYGYGADAINVTARSGSGETTLLNATFATGEGGVNFGAYSPQTYSDATPVVANADMTPTSAYQYLRFTGADASFSRNQSGNYADDYGLYDFGRGAGNPVLSFVAAGSTASVTFTRLGNGGDGADEFWALDDLRVRSIAPTVPEPGALALALLGLAVVGARVRRG